MPLISSPRPNSSANLNAEYIKRYIVKLSKPLFSLYSRLNRNSDKSKHAADSIMGIGKTGSPRVGCVAGYSIDKKENKSLSEP